MVVKVLVTVAKSRVSWECSDVGNIEQLFVGQQIPEVNVGYSPNEYMHGGPAKITELQTAYNVVSLGHTSMAEHIKRVQADVEAAVRAVCPDVIINKEALTGSAKFGLPAGLPNLYGSGFGYAKGNLVCSVCSKPWFYHSGWVCKDGHL